MNNANGEPPLILVVDDEEQLLTLIGYALEREGMSVETAETGEQALEIVRSKSVDLIVLDVLLPDGNGIDICRRIRRYSDAPIVFLTAMADQSNVIAGLEAGGDDYLAKPFSVEELLLRLRAILRRSTPAGDEIRLGDLVLYPGSYEMELGGEPVNLTSLEFRFLKYLAVNRSRIVPLSELVEEVWGVVGLGSQDPMVKSVVYKIRQKFGATARASVEIRNVRGVGYQLRSVS